MKWSEATLAGLLCFGWTAGAASKPLSSFGLPSPKSEVRSLQEPNQGRVFSGLSRVAELLASKEPTERISGYLRAIARGDVASLHLLVESVTTSKIERSAFEDLTLARVVAPHAQLSLLRPLVAHLAFGAGARLSPAEPLRLLAMQIDCLALAWSQSDEALRDLARALKTGGALSAAATEALLLYQPEPFARLFEPSLSRSPDWARLLGRAGRPAAIPVLRRELLQASSAMQLAAAEGLLALGDRALLPLLERWRNDAETPESFKQLATRARDEPRPMAPLDEQVTRVWSLPTGSPQLLRWIDAPGDIPKRLQVSADAEEQELLLSALLLATFREQQTPTLSSTYLRGKLDDHRLGFAAAALLARQAPESIAPLLLRRTAGLERPIAWALPYLEHDSPLLDPIAALLATDDPVLGESPLCVGLVHPKIRNAMTKQWLLAKAHSEGFCAPLAAEALASRDSVELRPVLRALLWAPHPLMRAAVARGLGLSLEPTAAGLLCRRFELEENVWVRRAIVRSLRRRNSGLGRQLLRDVARFDPDPLVRGLASPSDVGDRTAPRPRDPLEFWLDAGMAGSGSPPARQEPTGLLARPVILSFPAQDPSTPNQLQRIVIASGPDGASLPIVLDPGGRILLPMATRSLRLENYVR